MTTLIENNLPYKLYSAVNMGPFEGAFYLGKIPQNLSFNQKVYGDDYYQNCFSGYYFSIASLVPGSCIRMDIADEVDPNILIDAKWTEFRPCNATSCDSNTWGPKNNNIIHSVDNTDPMTTKPLFKSLATDGTVVISGLESGYIWNDEGVNNPNNGDHCTLYLQAWKYKFANVCEYLGFETSTEYAIGTYYGTIGSPGASDVIFLMKSLIGGKGIRVLDYGTYLQIKYIGGGQGECEKWQTPTIPITCEPYIPSNIGEFI